MEVAEILKIQRKCMSRARSIAKRVYRTSARIWEQRISVTPELEKTGLVGQINSRMPNLLLRRPGKPDIAETARAFGFESSQALAQFLASYQPRRILEQEIYARLLDREITSLTRAEQDMARSMEPGELEKLIRHCRGLADEMMAKAYEKYDEVWYGKIRITPELQKHGREVIAELNLKMPNMLTHDPRYLAADQVAMLYGFEYTQDLIDWLLDYQPRKGYRDTLCESLLREELGLPEADAMQPEACEPEIDEVPF